MLRTAILAALVPAALAATVLAAAYRVWRRDAPAAPARPALPLALALAFGVGSYVLVGWPAWPPVIANEVLVCVALAVGILGPLWTWDALPAPARLAAGLAVSLLVPWLLFRMLLETTWTGPLGWLRLAGLGAALAALWAGVAALGERVRGPSVPLALVLAATGAAVALGLSGSVLLGQLAGALAAGLGAVFLLTLRRPDVAVGRGTAPVFTVAYGGLLLIGTFYAELPRPAALLLFAAPLLPWLAELRPLRHRLGPRLAAGLRVLLVLAALGGALTLALRPPPEDVAANETHEPRQEAGPDYTTIPK